MRRGKPLAQVGRRATRERVQRDEMRAEVLAETGLVCVAKALMPEVYCWGPIEVHETIDRSVRPSVHLDSAFGVPLCHAHNMACNDDATRARECGLSFYSYQVDEARARAGFLRRTAR
jgi:hypothetical protein